MSYPSNASTIKKNDLQPYQLHNQSTNRQINSTKKIYFFNVLISQIIWLRSVTQKNKWILLPVDHRDVSENSGTPKSSILIGFSIINHAFRGTSIFGNTHSDHNASGRCRDSGWLWGSLNSSQKIAKSRAESLTQKTIDLKEIPSLKLTYPLKSDVVYQMAHFWGGQVVKLRKLVTSRQA